MRAASWQRRQMDPTYAPSSRNSHRAVMVLDKIAVIFGGRKGSSKQNTNDVLVQDFRQFQWARPICHGTPPGPREEHATCIIENNIYVFGGKNGSSNLLGDTWRLELNFDGDSPGLYWHPIKPVNSNPNNSPPPMSGHTMDAYNNKCIIFGGSEDNGSTFLDDTYTYNVDDNTFELMDCKNRPLARCLHSANIVDDKLVIFGGKGILGCGILGCFNDIQMLDLKTREWTCPDIKGEFPAGRCGHSAIAMDSKLFIFGGWNGIYCFNDIHMLDLKTLTWSSILSMGSVPAGRTYHSCVSSGATMYVFGGRNHDGLRRMYDTFSLSLDAILPQVAEASLNVKDTKEQEKLVSLLIPDTEQKLSRQEIVDKPKVPNRIGKHKCDVTDFDLKVTLGTGSFGRVRLCRHNETGSYYAMKILKKKEILRLKQVDHIMNEKNILCRINHCFIVNLRAYFQDKRNLYFVLDYIAGGEFFSHLRHRTKFNNKTARFYAAHIVLIFEYLHARDIVYRDLKPENLLIDPKGYLKVTDFGFAKKVLTRTWTLCGTPEYIAPEILLNKGHSKPVDWWALGVLIYEMLAGQPPFVDDTALGIYQKILASKTSLEFTSDFKADAKALIRRLLTPDISLRIGNLQAGANEVKEHVWFKNFNWEALAAEQLRTPWQPKVKSVDDTSNFDKYPESDGLAPEINLPEDPFKDF